MARAGAEGTGFVEVDGRRLEYRMVGPAPGDGPVIVLLHEGLGCVALWRDFPERLAAATGMGVFAYSRAGYGQSDSRPLPWPLDYMTREAREVVPGVLNAVGAEQVVLMGHSDGATIAAIHAGQVRDARVRGVILMAPHFFTEPVGLAAIAEAKRAYDAGGLRQRMAKYHRDPDNAFRGWNDAWLAEGFREWNVAAAIDGIGVPVLAIQGEGDEYGTLAQIEEIEARANVPVERLILPDCGHAPQFDQPGAVLAAVGDFLSRRVAR
ncbi:alpha/beta hydrolase [Aquicoccus porphyridii]|uniref:Alpha/beta hydrolase n=1 Tax=Aquicoccus porphyridii TaxID=1852029 RepID=A0A5A9ZGE4_9RHOB|nr:alpha/beta hydrolase [Aquicoccus porphyridii]KAA0916089.1 alpha/beta hydrolase [Aquicoccus porphyridii]RAI52728.1 alpha/beta hydrolase [Rhodobacteraceae bacterium AsT-22]